MENTNINSTIIKNTSLLFNYFLEYIGQYEMNICKGFLDFYLYLDEIESLKNQLNEIQIKKLKKNLTNESIKICSYILNVVINNLDIYLFKTNNISNYLNQLENDKQYEIDLVILASIKLVIKLGLLSREFIIIPFIINSLLNNKNLLVIDNETFDLITKYENVYEQEINSSNKDFNSNICNDKIKHIFDKNKYIANNHLTLKSFLTNINYNENNKDVVYSNTLLDISSDFSNIQKKLKSDDINDLVNIINSNEFSNCINSQSNVCFSNTTKNNLYLFYIVRKFIKILDNKHIEYSNNENNNFSLQKKQSLILRNYIISSIMSCKVLKDYYKEKIILKDNKLYTNNIYDISNIVIAYLSIIFKDYKVDFIENRNSFKINLNNKELANINITNLIELIKKTINEEIKSYLLSNNINPSDNKSNSNKSNEYDASINYFELISFTNDYLNHKTINILINFCSLNLSYNLIESIIKKIRHILIKQSVVKQNIELSNFNSMFELFPNVFINLSFNNLQETMNYVLLKKLSVNKSYLKTYFFIINWLEKRNVLYNFNTLITQKRQNFKLDNYDYINEYAILSIFYFFLCKTRRIFIDYNKLLNCYNITQYKENIKYSKKHNNSFVKLAKVLEPDIYIKRSDDTKDNDNNNICSVIFIEFIFFIDKLFNSVNKFSKSSLNCKYLCIIDEEELRKSNIIEGNDKLTHNIINLGTKEMKILSIIQLVYSELKINKVNTYSESLLSNNANEFNDTSKLKFDLVYLLVKQPQDNNKNVLSKLIAETKIAIHYFIKSDCSIFNIDRKSN